jgi:serine/threonine-protein kinase RsbW
VGSEDEVRLALPAKPELLGLARVTAAGLASRLGFTYDQVEDLRLAIDEVCFGVTGNKGREGSLQIRFLLTREALTVLGEGDFALPDPLRLSELSEVILGTLVDEHSVGEVSGRPRFKLVKRRQTDGKRARNEAGTGHGAGVPSGEGR